MRCHSLDAIIINSLSLCIVQIYHLFIFGKCKYVIGNYHTCGLGHNKCHLTRINLVVIRRNVDREKKNVRG